MSIILVLLAIMFLPSRCKMNLSQNVAGPGGDAGVF